MVLGYGNSISYDQLVQRITGDNLDKSHRFTDWTRRPLSTAQLNYAVSDVTHLRDVYVKLATDLEQKGRTEWMREEMKVLTSVETYRSEPEHAWERLRSRARKPREIAVLMDIGRLQPYPRGHRRRPDRAVFPGTYPGADRGPAGGAVMALAILSTSFFGLLLLGVPVAFAIGLSAVFTFLYEGLPLAIVFQRMASGMNIFSFLAIPFFIFAGELMLHSGVAERIVKFAKDLVGHVRGGLGMANVVACTLFGGVSGSPVADVSAMGATMIPMMKREGYDADYAVNVTTHASLVGALMPTSHNIIIYALAAGGQVSIAALILAGMLPALLLTICILAAAYLVAVKRGYPAGRFPGWEAVAVSLAAAVPGLFVIVIIVAGILSGVFTATESAAVAVVYSIVLSALLYQSLTFAHFVMAAAKAV